QRSTTAVATRPTPSRHGSPIFSGIRETSSQHAEIHTVLTWEKLRSEFGPGHQVTAVTLGNHMVVGVRKWRVKRTGRGSIMVNTEAWEQRNNVFTNAGFKIIGRDKMAEVWTNYLVNIGKAITAEYKGRYSLSPVFWKEQEKGENPFKKDVEDLYKE